MRTANPGATNHGIARAMKIVEDVNEAEARRLGNPVAVMVRSADDPRIQRTVAALGLASEPDLLKSAGSRPRVHVDGDRIGAVIFMADEEMEPAAVRVLAGRRGVLIVARDDVLDSLRPVVDGVDGDGKTALAAVLLRLGHQAEAGLDDAAVPVREFESRALGYSSAPARRQINQMRAQFMGLQHLYAAHARLLASDEDLARAVPDSEARLLRRARSAYDGATDSAARLYAFLGDVLTQQSMIASERLTLVATIFLPLTVITAFFGMNFGWLVDRIGTATAFVLLGLVAPVLLTVATSLIIRRLTGPEL
jgi:Mg2+ and Co2+ transporter CorA